MYGVTVGVRPDFIGMFHIGGEMYGVTVGVASRFIRGGGGVGVVEGV